MIDDMTYSLLISMLNLKHSIEVVQEMIEKEQGKK